MTASFTRQRGEESAVQLNRLQDRSALPTQTVTDQVFAIPARFQRGRIDQAFKVDASNARAKLGFGEPVRVSRLNEAHVHVIEALDNGAYECVVSRLVPSSAKIKWLVCKRDAEKSGQGGEFTFSVSEAEPVGDFFFAIKHLECFNDGIKVALHAAEETVGGMDLPVNRLTIQLLDKDGAKLYEYTGSLNSDSVDDYQQPDWLPDVVTERTTNLQLLCVEEGEIEPTSSCYGNDDNGRAKWVESEVLICFDEGGFAYTVMDYVAARKRLQFTPHNYWYLSSGGSQSIALLGHIAQLAYDTNTQFRFDISGELTPDEAIAFMEQLNATGQKEAHLLHAYWAPIKSSDPAGINAKGYFGVATLNIAYACGRNARKNAKGFAPKNFPVAGKDWPINRQRMEQTYTPSGPELSKLAKAKINVVCLEEYDDGAKYVFRDSITCAPVSNSLKKLINVVEMACHTDDAVTRFCKAALQKPMSVSVKASDDFLRTYFTGAQDADWIKPSADPAMEGLAAKWLVAPNEAKPYELMDVAYSVRYDGTNRSTDVTQTLSR